MPSQQSAIIGALTDVTTSATNDLGTIYVEKSSGGTVKRYKYVMIKNVTATVAGAAGSMVAYSTVANGGYSSNWVTVDLTDADNLPFAAGALLATVTGTAGTAYYGWIQIGGLVTLDTAITSGADGAPIYLTATDKTAAKAIEADSTGVYKQVCGIAYDASEKIVVLTCPE